MALRDQPYFPLYVDDILSDEKLNECSANAHGVYLKLMCLMHKSEVYGVILLEQKYKQNDNQIVNFASKFARHMPFTFDEILSALSELVYEKVVYIEGDRLIQKRMVKDNEISIIRAEAGSKGGKVTQFDKAKKQANSKAKHQANTEYGNENVNEDYSLKGGVGENGKTWRKDFEIYKSELMKVYQELLIDAKYITEQEKFHPGVDISLSLEKAVTNYWITEAGWKKKKAKRDADPDWRRTLTNAIDLNKVYKNHGTNRQYNGQDEPRDYDKDGKFLKAARSEI